MGIVPTPSILNLFDCFRFEHMYIFILVDIFHFSLLFMQFIDNTFYMYVHY